MQCFRKWMQCFPKRPTLFYLNLWFLHSCFQYDCITFKFAYFGIMPWISKHFVHFYKTSSPLTKFEKKTIHAWFLIYLIIIQNLRESFRMLYFTVLQIRETPKPWKTASLVLPFHNFKSEPKCFYRITNLNAAWQLVKAFQEAGESFRWYSKLKPLVMINDVSEIWWLSPPKIIVYRNHSQFVQVWFWLQCFTVKQESVFELNEQGVEATSAVAAVVVLRFRQLPINFTINRPFLFLIEDVSTQAWIFIGRIEDPR